MINYQYMVSNNKIPMIFDQIKTAAQPSKFSHEFLKNMGFTSSNDRVFVTVLKNLGFLNSDGIPTSYYADLRDETRAKKIIATRIKSYYKDLFAINTSMHSASDEDIKGAISRVTGKEEKDVKRIMTTFKSLCKYADFSDDISSIEPPREEASATAENIQQIGSNINDSISPDFHYNIQIHLPATTDISVYNAIFKSIKENLLK